MIRSDYGLTTKGFERKEHILKSFIFPELWLQNKETILPITEIFISVNFDTFWVKGQTKQAISRKNNIIKKESLLKAQGKCDQVFRTIMNNKKKNCKTTNWPQTSTKPISLQHLIHIDCSGKSYWQLWYKLQSEMNIVLCEKSSSWSVQTKTEANSWYGEKLTTVANIVPCRESFDFFLYKWISEIQVKEHSLVYRRACN